MRRTLAIAALTLALGAVVAPAQAAPCTPGSFGCTAAPPTCPTGNFGCPSVPTPPQTCTPGNFGCAAAVHLRHLVIHRAHR